MRDDFIMCPKVYIIILNFNNYKDTICCLKSISQLHYTNYFIVVCDNNSRDNSEVEILNWIRKGKYSNIKYIQTGDNRGYAGGNNVGIRFAMQQNDMDYVWILNNDTIVDNFALDELIKIVANNPQIGMCGSKLVYSWNHEKIQGYGGIYNKFTGMTKNIIDIREIEKMDYVIGAAMLVSKSFLKNIGLMNEEYFLYFEELDWAVRSKKRFKLACAAKSIVYHKEGATTGSNIVKKRTNDLAAYFSVRNRLLFTKKYYKECLVTVSVRLLFTVFKKVITGEFSQSIMFFKLFLNIKDQHFERLVRKYK